MDPITLEDVKRLRLEPGDQLVVRVPRGMSFDAIEHVGKALEARFGDRVLLVSDDVEVTVVSGLEPEHVRHARYLS